MNTILTIGFVITLFTARLLGAGGWFGSVSLLGLLLTFVDYYNKIRKANSHINKNGQCRRFAIVQLVIIAISLVSLFVLLWNVIYPITWVSAPLFLDVVSLIGLLLAMVQDTFLGWINTYIQAKNKS